MRAPKIKTIDLEALSGKLKAMAAEGNAEDAIDLAISLMGGMQDRSVELMLRLALQDRQRSGRRTEKIDPAQLSLLLFRAKQEAGESIEENEPFEEDDTGLPPEPRARGQAKRRKLPEHLPREEVLHDVTEEQKRCACCGDALHRIGDEVSEVLELVPVQFKVLRHVRPKYACRRCQDGVIVAPPADKVIEKGMAGPGLLAHVVVSKYEDHLPLNRLESIYERGGVRIPTSTLADWVAAVADLTKPLAERIRARVQASHVVAADASGLKVLDRDDPDGIRKGTVWCYVGDRKDAYFDYAPSGTGEAGPWRFLEGRKGYVQADAASIFDRLYDGQVAKAIEVGCWAHARRKYFQLKEADSRAAWPIQLIGELYRVERRADRDNLSPAQRVALRRERSTKVLEKLERWLAKNLEDEPPKSALAQACGYTVRQWKALTRFLEDGRLGLDNNLCERQLRSLAVGRKNYLFAGSDDGAERAAGLYTLLRTAALHDLDPFQYLEDVLTKLAGGWTMDRIDELLPGHWVSLKPTEKTTAPQA